MKVLYEERVWRGARQRLTGSHGEGVAGEGSSLVHGTRGSHNLHDLLLAACTQGRATGRQQMPVFCT